VTFHVDLPHRRQNSAPHIWCERACWDKRTSRHAIHRARTYNTFYVTRAGIHQRVRATRAPLLDQQVNSMRATVALLSGGCTAILHLLAPLGFFPSCPSPAYYTAMHTTALHYYSWLHLFFSRGAMAFLCIWARPVDIHHSVICWRAWALPPARYYCRSPSSNAPRYLLHCLPPATQHQRLPAFACIYYDLLPTAPCVLPRLPGSCL